jgi:hypothetical protein
MTRLAEYCHLVGEGADFDDVGLAELRQHMKREEVQRTMVWLKLRTDTALQKVAALVELRSNPFPFWNDETEAESPDEAALCNAHDEVEPSVVGCSPKDLNAQARALADWDFDNAWAERDRRLEMTRKTIPGGALWPSCPFDPSRNRASRTRHSGGAA